MTERALTPFEHILLGMVCLAPSSGYDLKRIFATTPMGLYQPSSGTLYPALRRLEDKDLIQAQAPSGPAAGSGRTRHVYEITPAGRAAHLDWLRTPVEPATVSPDLGLHLMRFVMMEHLLPRDEVLDFLHSLAAALAALTGQLEQYVAAGGPSGVYPPLALQHGIAVHRASLRWAQETIAALSAAS
jgi:DNA-binding PadR family transcriptional regulator